MVALFHKKEPATHFHSPRFGARCGLRRMHSNLARGRADILSFERNNLLLNNYATELANEEAKIIKQSSQGLSPAGFALTYPMEQRSEAYSQESSCGLSRLDTGASGGSASNRPV